MPWLFILGLIALGLSVLLFRMSKKSSALLAEWREEIKGYKPSYGDPIPQPPSGATGGHLFGKFGAWVVLGLGALFILLSIVLIVPANTVAVVVAAGKPVDVRSNGPQLKMPWEETIEFPGQRQFIYFLPEGDAKANEKDDDEYFPCPRVRLASGATAGATACITGTIEWQMLADTGENRERALQLYKDYKTFATVRGFFLRSRSVTVFGDVFANHNPLVETQNQSVSELGAQVLAGLRTSVENRLMIHSVNLGVPDYDERTDLAIASLQAERANTETAKQKALTAEQEALAAGKLADLASNPAYTQNKCLDIASQGIAKGIDTEPGLCLLGGTDGLIVNP